MRTSNRAAIIVARVAPFFAIAASCALACSVTAVTNGGGTGDGGANADTDSGASSSEDSGAGGDASTAHDSGNPPTCTPASGTPTPMLTGLAGSDKDLATDGTDVFVSVSGDSTIRKVPIAGGSAITIATGQDTPQHITLDATNAYWTNFATVQSMAKSVTQTSTPTQLAHGETFPEAIVVNASQVYWTTFTSPGAVSSASLTGDQVVHPIASVDYGTALVLAGTYAYFTNGAIIYRAPIGGGAATPWISGLGTVISLAIDATNLYWADSSNNVIEKQALNGTTHTPIASSQSEAQAVAIDSTNIYWTNYGDGTVMRAGLDGSCVTKIASAQAGPSAIAVDGHNVYWINAGTVGASFADGALMSVGK